MAPRTTAMPAQRNWFDSYFKVTEAGSTIGTEVRGGLTNFLVMSYILVVNAVILSSARLPLPAVVPRSGFLTTAALCARGVKGALLLGIVGATIVGILVNAATGGAEYKALPGVAVAPQNWLDTPDLSTIGQGLNFTVFAKLGVITAILTIFSLMLSDFFDTVGTVTSVAAEGGWLGKDGQIPRANRVFWVDSLGALFGGIFGTSSNTTYIESGAGVAEGAKKGLAILLNAVLVLLAIFLAPIAGIVPPQATSAALMLVGWFMFKPLLDLNKTGDVDFATGFAILLTVFVMPLTYSITNGIGAGFLAYSFLKLVSGKSKGVTMWMWISSVAFIVYFANAYISAHIH